MQRDSKSVGLYAHVPFCERVCPYCDFAVVAARPLRRDDEARYVAAMLRELEARAESYGSRSLASIYLGGGTPSLLHPESVSKLIDFARSRFVDEVDEGAEITLEVNPSTIERERLPGFLAAGVNRLSIGIQSFDDRVLQKLGRAHRASEGRESFAAARAAGFANISVDLIFAAPGQSLSQLEGDLEELVALEPEHVSTYELTVEPGTPFATAEARGQLARVDEDGALAMFERIAGRLERTGLPRYEISSHARPGYESRHNMRYWRREPILGIGLSAWSTEPPRQDAPHGVRVANRRDLEGYLVRVEAGESPVAEREELSERTARGEAVFLALRRSDGLAAEAFAREFGAFPRAFFADEIDSLLEADLLEESEGGDLRLTARGIPLSDSVFERFVA